MSTLAKKSTVLRTYYLEGEKWWALPTIYRSVTFVVGGYQGLQCKRVAAIREKETHPPVGWKNQMPVSVYKTHLDVNRVMSAIKYIYKFAENGKD